MVLILCILFPKPALEAQTVPAPELDKNTWKGLDLTPLLPVWNPFYSVSAYTGYKDNVTLSHRNRENSGFVSIAGDLTLWRRPIEDGREFQASFSGADRRFWSASPVDHESWSSLRARYLQDVDEHWQWITDLEANYLDLAVDISSVDTTSDRRSLRGFTLTALTGARWKWQEAWWLQLSPLVGRAWLSGVFDGYNELGGQWMLGHPYGRGSEWRLEYTPRWRTYDTRTLATSTGITLPGTHLEYLRHDFQWVHKYVWGKAKRWRLNGKIGGLVSSDNGSGYFDYWRAAVSETLEFQTVHWGARVEVGAAHYQFGHQRSQSRPSDKRERDDLLLTTRLEYRVLSALKLVAEYGYEGAAATDSVEAFTANTIFGGLTWEF